MSKTEIKVEAL